MGKTHLQQGTGHENGKIYQEIMLKKQAKSLGELIGSSDTEFANLADAARLRADLSEYLRNNRDKSLARALCIATVATMAHWLLSPQTPNGPPGYALKHISSLIYAADRARWSRR